MAIFNEYGELLISFFIEKHQTTINLCKYCIKSKEIILKIKENILNLRILPEMSDYSYAKA
jgi:hypothetical protein